MAEKMSEKTSADMEKTMPHLSKLDDIEIGETVALDAAEIFLQEHGYTHSDLHPLLEDESRIKQLRRSIDFRLLPLLCGTFVLQYIDKQALSYSAVFDLFDDTGTSSDEYSWLVSLFYFGYLFWEYPASHLAQRLPTGKVVAVHTVTWGAMLMITAACSNFAGLAVCRFLLGCFESPITPCFMMIVGMWYLREEQPLRAGLFYCCNGVGSMVGGILCYAIGQIDDFPVWKAIMLICGGITFAWGFVLLAFLPDSVIAAKQFSVEEKAIIIGRGIRNQTGILNRTIKWDQIKEAFCDLQVWLLFIYVFLNEFVNGGFANFGKLIIKGIVKTPLLTVAYGIPQGAFQVFFIVSGAYLATKFRNLRTYIMVLYLFPTIVGLSLIWKLPRDNHIGLLFGYYIAGAYVSSLVLALQMPSTNIGGYTKRVTATAFVFLAYCIGNICGPHVFYDNEAPLYETGLRAEITCVALQVGVALLLRLLLIRRNKMRDAKAAETGVGRVDGDAVENDDPLNDLTDFENPRFRYVL